MGAHRGGVAEDQVPCGVEVLAQAAPAAHESRVDGRRLEAGRAIGLRPAAQ